MSPKKYREIPKDKINLNSTRTDLNPYIPPKEDRPICCVEGCTAHVEIISTLKDGSPNFRKCCTLHRIEKIKKDNNVKSVVELTAKRNGFTTASEYINSIHPYRKHHKNYCENIDGRLGFVCTTTIKDPCMLDTDHIDGNPFNNDKNNLQTLCSCCHKYKTKINGDGQTIGRKKLKLLENSI